MKVHSRNKLQVLLAFCALISLSVAFGENTNAGWTTLGAMPAPAWDGKALTFHSDQGTLAIALLGDDVIRVRFTTAKSFGRDHSYAVVDHDFGATSAKADIGNNSTTLSTRSLKVTVQHAPLRISFVNAAGESLDTDD